MGRRSRILWRTTIVLVALGLAAMVVHAGVATWLARRDPARAARFAPGNARIAAVAASSAIDHGARPESPTIQHLVGAALARDTTIPAAIELRALAAQAAGDDRREARLFELSNAIGRRSLATRLWLIQRAVDRGDVAGALDDFDVALRTSSAAPDVLFPVLARASADPTLTLPIARMLDRPEDWRVMFLDYAITKGGAAADIGKVMLHMRDRAMIRANQIDQALVGQLVKERRFAMARTVDDAFHPPMVPAGFIDDPHFTDPSRGFPFGWELLDKGAAGAERTVIGGRPALAYRSLPGGIGPVAVQLLTLPPGRYRLLASAAAPTRDPTSPPYWTVTCGETNGALLALLDQPTIRNARAAIDFSVGAVCSAQWLMLTLRQSDEADGQSGAVASVSLSRR